MQRTSAASRRFCGSARKNAFASGSGPSSSRGAVFSSSGAALRRGIALGVARRHRGMDVGRWLDGVSRIGGWLVPREVRAAGVVGNASAARRPARRARSARSAAVTRSCRGLGGQPRPQRVSSSCARSSSAELGRRAVGTAPGVTVRGAGGTGGNSSTGVGCETRGTGGSGATVGSLVGRCTRAAAVSLGSGDGTFVGRFARTGSSTIVGFVGRSGGRLSGGRCGGALVIRGGRAGSPTGGVLVARFLRAVSSKIGALVGGFARFGENRPEM